MKLRVKDAAKLLDVSEKTIYRWISQEKLPFHQVNNQYRFNRAELLEWVISSQMPISPKLLEEPEESYIPSLAEALQIGGIHYHVEGSDKAEVLHSVVDILALPQEVDREFLKQVFLARESLGSTAIGNGIAIPHARSPIALHINRAFVSICFLENPIDFQAIDGMPVHTLFTIVSPTIKAHLSLLSKISYGLRQGSFLKAVAYDGLREDIIQAAVELDDHIAQIK